MAKMISDDVYESGKDTFVPGVGHKATINEDREVELITKKTKYE